MDKQSIIKLFLNTLKSDQVKYEAREFCRPLLLIILQEIYPYMYFTLAFIIINFILLLGIFFILLKKKYIKLS